MKNLLTAFLLLFFFQITHAQRNIVLIIADDLGSDWCGFQENRMDTANMPNVRKLLSRGVRFSNVWSNPICSPSRAGMLTGRYSFRTGIGSGIGGAGNAGLDTSEITIPRLLKHANAPIKYATANIGKWHLHTQNAQSLTYPNLMGYDLFSGHFQGAIQDYFSWAKTVNGVTTNTINYAATEQTNDAIKWLGQQNNAKPFFLWMAFTLPHDPLHLPPDTLHSYRNLSGTAADITANPKTYFKAMVESMDNQVGKLYNWLQANNKLDSTDIIFLGDNGDEATVAQIPRAKGSIYQAGITVPFIITGPSVKNQGRVSNALVNFQDVFATIVEMAGFTNWRAQIPANKPIDSKSLMPILQNTATSVRPWAFTEVFSPAPPANSKEGKAMRNTDFKLMNFDNGTQEFYNITNDPTERTNLLNRTLTATERTNYTYLCTEMGLLLNKTVCTTVGTQDVLQKEQPIVSPNPVRQSVSVVFANALPFSYQIHAIDGKMLLQGVSSKDINTSALPNGLFLLKIQQQDAVFIEKITVER
jgi:arylsulfatase B